MADVKITALPAIASVALADVIPIVDDVAGTPATTKATVTQLRAALVPIALTADVSGTLPVANGGTGITALAAGIATFLGTPSGANLASALTTALPDSKGGTGLTALASGIATFLGTPSGANLASALTTALPDSKGGTGLTALGANVATFLGTPTTANLLAAVTGETGTGAVMFNIDPTIVPTRINNATSGGTINNCTLGATAGSLRRIYFTDAVGPTVTGFDASGVADGTILRVTAVGGTVAFDHESGSSTAANRITCGGLTINLPSGSHVDFEYDGTNSRWRAGAGTAI